MKEGREGGREMPPEKPRSERGGKGRSIGFRSRNQHDSRKDLYIYIYYISIYI